jgi:hypothetical protein
MVFITDPKEIYQLYEQAKLESREWREDYHEYERLADNDLIEDLDPNLPEVNDGTLAAALFKLPKRIVNSDLKGRAISMDRDEEWITELANIQWEEEIIPNANTQATFHRKWKDAVRKAAIYGSVPLINLFTERGDYLGSDFIVAQPQDVILEAGKVSDYDSDLIFWEVYYTKQQVKNLIQTAKKEQKTGDGYSKWYLEELEATLQLAADEERATEDDHRSAQEKNARRKGIQFCVAFQRGVDAPFYMFHKSTKKIVREWSNQDPSGDLPVHFLYCYQDFINPYGVGIVKLAGGTQNVLDYMRQSDVLATQLGFRPPVSISGAVDTVDLDSIVYERDALWFVGEANVQRQEISNQIYQQLPSRMSMYKISLDQLLPTGDTSIATGSGDTNYSKTPAGVKFQQNNLSIDDEDFKDNLYMTYEAVAKSMINIQFANMQGVDIMRLGEEQRERLIKAGLEFPVDEQGEVSTNQLEVIWDEVRSTFNFKMDAEQDKTSDEAKRLEALLKVVELRASDPSLEQSLADAGKKLDLGELFISIISLTSDNDKIVQDMTEEDIQALQEKQQQAMQAEGQQVDYSPREMLDYKDAPEDVKRQMEQAAGYQPSQMPSPVQQDNETKQQANVIKERQVAMAEEKQTREIQNEDQQNATLQAIIEAYEVDANTAQAMLEAERQGYPIEQIVEAVVKQKSQPVEGEATNG